MPATLPDPPVELGPPSMLSRKFGPEIANYFSGNPLNRVSFLRPDTVFLNAALRHPSTKFLLLKDMAPLTIEGKEIDYVSPDAVKDIIDAKEGGPYAKSEDEIIADYDSRTWTPTLIFLGLDRHDEANPDVFSFKDGRYKGTPYFALDISPPPSYLAPSDAITALATKASAIAAKFTADGKAEFVGNRMNLSLNPPDAAIFAAARHTLDWNLRNPFCSTCGSRTVSTHGGWKRTCASTDAGASSERPSCSSRKGVSNVCFPRTDAVIIAAVVSADGQSMLLGRGARFPPGMYSTLAGFLEPGETIEEAVRREVWEEAGVAVARVVIHSTQPWPYPANIMVGAIAQAVPGEEARKPILDHDVELEDARWVRLDEVRQALKGAEWVEEIGPSDPVAQSGEFKLKLPPATAIAHQLMEAVCGGFLLGSATKI
jgi:NAD+ diphosphatase